MWLVLLRCCCFDYTTNDQVRCCLALRVFPVFVYVGKLEVYGLLTGGVSKIPNSLASAHFFSDFPTHGRRVSSSFCFHVTKNDRCRLVRYVAQHVGTIYMITGSRYNRRTKQKCSRGAVRGRGMNDDGSLQYYCLYPHADVLTESFVFWTSGTACCVREEKQEPFLKFFILPCWWWWWWWCAGCPSLWPWFTGGELSSLKNTYCYYCVCTSTRPYIHQRDKYYTMDTSEDVETYRVLPVSGKMPS